MIEDPMQSRDAAYRPELGRIGASKQALVALGWTPPEVASSSEKPQPQMMLTDDGRWIEVPQALAEMRKAFDLLTKAYHDQGQELLAARSERDQACAKRQNTEDELAALTSVNVRLCDEIALLCEEMQEWKDEALAIRRAATNHERSAGLLTIAGIPGAGQGIGAM
jgi:hypothetical protein